MKKSIQSFLIKLKENNDGTVSGGFGSVRGGFNLNLLRTNSPCENSGTCSGTNVAGCTNSGQCSGSTNKEVSCHNTGTCFS